MLGREKALLQLLKEAGSRVSKKAQTCKEEERYLGFKEGHKVPDPSWVLSADGTSLIKQGQRLSG